YMDALGPDVAPGVGTPVRGGLSYREAHLAMELIAESGLASSLDVVEVNPVLERETELSRMNEQRWHAQRFGRRRRSGELAVHGDDGTLAVAETQAAVGVLQQVLAHLLLEMLARRRRT